MFPRAKLFFSFPHHNSNPSQIEFYEKSYLELENILAYKEPYFKNEIKSFVNIHKLVDVLTEEKLKEIIEQTVDEQFLERIIRYYAATLQMRQEKQMSLPGYPSEELKILVSNKHQLERISQVKDYYLRCYRKASVFSIIEGGYSFGQPNDLSIAIAVALLNKNPHYRMIDQYHQIRISNLKNMYGLKSQGSAFDPSIQARIFETIFQKIDTIGTIEDESTSRLYISLEKARLQLGKKMPDGYLQENVCLLGFRAQRDILNNFEKSILEKSDLDSDTQESLRFIIEEAHKQIKIPTNEDALKLLELCIKLRAKMLRYCADKSSKIDKPYQKIHAVESAIQQLDKSIKHIREDRLVHPDVILGIISNLNMQYSRFPDEILAVYHAALRSSSSSEMAQAHSKVPANVSVQSRTHNQTDIQENSAYWYVDLSHFTQPKIQSSLQKIIAEYGNCESGNVYTELVNRVQKIDDNKLRVCLAAKAINGRINVYQVMMECALLSKDQQLANTFNEIASRALFHQYELLIDKVMQKYEFIQFNAAAVDHLYKLLSEMVPFVQRGYQGQHDDPISASLFEVELNNPDKRSDLLLNRIEESTVEQLPTLAHFLQIETETDLILNNQKESPASKKFHFF